MGLCVHVYVECLCKLRPNVNTPCCAGAMPFPSPNRAVVQSTHGLLHFVFGACRRLVVVGFPDDQHNTEEVSGEGIKSWGIAGIRIGTFDRFGRGPGEFKLP